MKISNYVNKIITIMSCLVLIVLLLFLPILRLQDMSNNLIIEPKTMFGFNIIVGYRIPNPSIYSTEGNYIPILHSTVVSLIPIFCLLGIIVLFNIKNESFGKEIINAILAIVACVIFGLFPVILLQYTYETYQPYLEFVKLAGWYVDLIFLCIFATYQIVYLIVSGTKRFKEVNKFTEIPKPDEG